MRKDFERFILGLASLWSTEDAILPLVNANVINQPNTHTIEFNVRELTLAEQIQMYKDEFESEIIEIFEKNFQKINALRPNGKLGDLQVLKMNYVFYRLAQDEFDVPWFVLWLIHDAESTCSFDDIAYVPGPDGQYGAMQRASDFHPDSQVAAIAARYPILVKLPQKRAGDGSEIMWAAQKLDSDAKSAMRQDLRKDRTWGLADAVIGYSARTIGQARWESMQVLNGIFGGW